MSKLIKSKLFLFTGILIVLSTATTAFAQDYVDPCAEQSWYCLDAGNTGAYLGQIISLVFAIAAIAAFGYLIFGGIRWITSGGDKGGVEAARNTIIAAIIGLVIVFFSYFIINFVIYFLTGNTLGAIDIPSLTSSNPCAGTTTSPQNC